MRTLILGMGNPILSDDGVGIQVARMLKSRLNREDVTVMETSMAGLNLPELLEDFDRAILIDAIQTGSGEIGRIYRFGAEALDATRRASSSHGLNFSTALELGSRLGLTLPKDIAIFAIEVADVDTFGERCTSRVEEVIPAVADMIFRELDGG
ncbi:hydrogenase maturation protease [Chloroflexota bacterium]